MKMIHAGLLGEVVLSDCANKLQVLKGKHEENLFSNHHSFTGCFANLNEKVANFFFFMF